MRQNHLRQALLNLVRLTDVRYQREGRDAFQPFIDALREVEVALTHGKPTRKRQDTTRKLTLQTAHEVLAKWEREKAARPNEGKAIAAEWVPYMKELGYEQKIRQGPYPALRYLLRHARQVLDRGD